jgi:23S rRNA-/tRNA-specific pseudouridylate synthase
MENATTVLSTAMTLANKTYVALVRGEGILNGEDLRQKGWFPVTRPIKDERGVLNNATTYFRFVAGQDNGGGTLDRPRASLVLARPLTGRWHQIRRHLNGLSHPILGDATHGNSQVNREWKEQRGMPPERLCLHLAQMILPPTPACPNGIYTSCPIPDDIMGLLEQHLPDVLEKARPILERQGITFQHAKNEIVLPFSVKG